MTKFEKDVFNRFDTLKDSISEVKTSIAEIKSHLDADYSALHGNGKPGLIADHQDLEKRVQSLELKPVLLEEHQTLKNRVDKLEHDFNTQSGIAGKIVIATTWFITTAIALYNLFRK